MDIQYISFPTLVSSAIGYARAPWQSQRRPRPGCRYERGCCRVWRLVVEGNKKKKRRPRTVWKLKEKRTKKETKNKNRSGRDNSSGRDHSSGHANSSGRCWTKKKSSFWANARVRSRRYFSTNTLVLVEHLTVAAPTQDAPKQSSLANSQHDLQAD